jgi:pyridoxal phosphate enzyme (YggS family)
MVDNVSSVGENIERIRGTIAEAAAKSGRNADTVRIMAVTKTVDDERIMEAIACGINLIGENYVQEARRKIEKMGHDSEWHMIGHLQSNKAKYAVGLFDMIHSVDRIGLAKELDKRAAGSGIVMKVLVEVNTGGEETKSGVTEEETIDLVRAISALDNLSVQGLMTMPPWFGDPEDGRPYFVALRDLKNRIVEKEIAKVEMAELSMGMTDDYGIAVEEGATIVRIGRAIFGERE